MQHGRVFLEKKAVMKKGHRKIPGTFFLTEEKILFKFLLRKGEISIPIKNIDEVRIVGRLRKKLQILEGKNEYIFLMKGIENVHHLLLSIPNIYKNSSNTIT